MTFRLDFVFLDDAFSFFFSGISLSPQPTFIARSERDARLRVVRRDGVATDITTRLWARMGTGPARSDEGCETEKRAGDGEADTASFCCGI